MKLQKLQLLTGENFTPPRRKGRSIFVGLIFALVITAANLSIAKAQAAGSALGSTAGDASISGRVTTADGRGIRNAVLSLMDSSTGELFTVRSDQFGYYRFNEIEVGNMYHFVDKCKAVYVRPEFKSNRAVSTNVPDADFTALP